MKCWLCGKEDGTFITGILPNSYVHPKCAKGEIEVTIWDEANNRLIDDGKNKL